ncbi:hypothetical protein AA313_de0202495 [Arthrobotrys entomopaga]|nr:hypothetical protein AA313_de0202495 [Arthrobotrys entomopaga]
MIGSRVLVDVLAFTATALLLVSSTTAATTKKESTKTAPATTPTQISTPQLDPVVNFCKRYQHQSAITSNTLFIDGGAEWFHDDPIVWGPATPGINTYLVTTDMSDSWDWKGNISQTSIFKTTQPGRKIGYVPSLDGGAIWPNQNETHLYLYGGTTNSSLSNFTLYEAPESDAQTLWKYSIADRAWDPVAYAKGSPFITRASFGASVVAPNLNKAFYLGGILDKGSTDLTGDLMAPRFLDGLLEFDFETEAVRNISTLGLGSRARSYSQMVYIPEYGNTNNVTGKKGGVLVVIGGEQKSSQIIDVNGNRRGDPVAMSDIALYDIATESWFVQQASPHANEFPRTRTDHCVVVRSAPDGSSQNIYVYGGIYWDTKHNATYLDDVWILTLPSFQWIKIYEGESPRYGHTCHIAPEGRQMITVGGLGGYYTANFNDSQCDWETKSVALYDLTTLSWGSAYMAYGKYQLPVEVAQRVNGTQDGGAAIVSPTGGWSSLDIQALFVPPRVVKKSHTAAIVGGVIGGLAGVGFIIAAGYFYYQRYIKKADRPIPPPPEKPQWVKPELEGTLDPTSPNKDHSGMLHEIGDGAFKPAPVEAKGREIPSELP